MGGIPTYYDNWVQSLETSGNADDFARHARHMAWADEPRFQSFDMRRSVDPAGLDPKRRSEIPRHVMIASQGTRRPCTWRDLDLYKSSFDLAILMQLLAELRPAVIVEAGSGTGASALWLADMSRALRLGTRILSIDLKRADATDPDVTFLQGDAGDMAEVFDLTRDRNGPMLVLEDAHTAVGAVLNQAHDAMASGDYILVEDSVGKADAIAQFLADKGETYLVDTDLTDFFGRNATSCVDSIFRRMS